MENPPQNRTKKNRRKSQMLMYLKKSAEFSPNTPSQCISNTTGTSDTTQENQLFRTNLHYSPSTIKEAPMRTVMLNKKSEKIGLNINIKKQNY